MSVPETGGPPPCRHPPVVYDGMSQSESDGGIHYPQTPTVKEKMF